MKFIVTIVFLIINFIKIMSLWALRRISFKYHLSTHCIKQNLPHYKETHLSTPCSHSTAKGSARDQPRLKLCELAPVPLNIFRSNSKFDENSERSSFTYIRPITTIFCTRHDSDTVVTCTKYRCYRVRIFYTRVFWIFIDFGWLVDSRWNFVASSKK